MKKHSVKKSSPRTKLIILLVIVIAVCAVYIGVAIYFSKHFFPQTTVNSLPCGLDNAETVDKIVEDEADNYVLTITDKDNVQYTLTGSDFSYDYTLAESSSVLLKEQGAFLWPKGLFSSNDLTLDINPTYDSDALKNLISKLDLFDSSKITETTDASLEPTDTGYEIVEEVYGNDIDKSIATDAIMDAISSGLSEVTLSADLYPQPSVLSTDEVLINALDDINDYFESSITYEIEGFDASETVDSSIINDFISIDDDYNISLDEDAVGEYVSELARKYNTYGDERQFKTHSGKTITLGGGDYGWVIDQDAEKTQLIADIKSGETITRNPEYSQEAFVRGVDDVGDTYIEIDYSAQHLYYYVDGEKYLDSDVVTGDLTKGNGSPDGFYKVNYKQSPATLVGENYSSDVTYFMQFAYNIGFHDASWRSSFGGSIYKGNGSHGCINLPLSAASKLYEKVETGTPVVAYYSESVSLTNANVPVAYSYNKNK